MEPARFCCVLKSRGWCGRRGRVLAGVKAMPFENTRAEEEEEAREEEEEEGDDCRLGVRGVSDSAAERPIANVLKTGDPKALG